MSPTSSFPRYLADNLGNVANLIVSKVLYADNLGNVANPTVSKVLHADNLRNVANLTVSKVLVSVEEGIASTSYSKQAQ